MGRQNSTAAIIIASDPPGRNVCAFIRGIARSRTRVIVVGQSGKLAPGNLQDLLKVQLPDVTKFEVIDMAEGGGSSVCDAIEAMSAQGLYKPGNALEVFCSPEVAQAFAAEIDAGQLDLDPTTIRVQPQQMPVDDLKSIMGAVKSRDPSGMRKLLDPHLFSDSDGVAKYRNAILNQGGGLAAFGGSSVPMQEFLVDIAPNRELAIQVLHDVLAGELGQRGLDIHDFEYLGSGRNGSAYRSPDGLVVKVTTDPVEAASAERLVGHPSAFIHLIHGVRQLGERVWMIAQEGGLEKLPEEYREEFDVAMEAMEAVGAGHYLREGDWDGALECLSQCSDPGIVPEVLETCVRFGVPGMCEEVRVFGLSADFHSGNIMLREGCPVLTDLGTPGDAPGPRTESRLHELIKDIGGEDGAMRVAQVNSQMLSGKGINVAVLRPLGRGQMGMVFDIGNGKVLKITTDADEVETIGTLVNRKLRHVVQFYDVFPLENAGAKVWGAIADQCHPLSQQEEYDIMDVAERLRDERVIDDVATRRWADVVTAVQSSIRDDATLDMGGGHGAIDPANPKVARVVSRQMADFLTKAKKYGFPEMVDELRSVGIQFADYKPENIMKSSNGNYVIVDLSMSKSGKGGLGEVAGLHPAPAAGSGGQLRGAGSSAWSGGRGVLAKPTNHVPEDENAEYERDSALDWGFYSAQK